MNQPHQEEKKAFWTWNLALWGGLAFVVVVNVGVAILASQEPPAIVEENPFETGLAFDNQQISRRNAREEGYSLKISKDTILLLKNKVEVPSPIGEIRIQRPNDPTLDQQFALEQSAPAILLSQPLSDGRWNVRYQFSDGDRSFEIQTALTVQCTDHGCNSK
jgi:nitrogen fixation protein FixH